LQEKVQADYIIKF